MRKTKDMFGKIVYHVAHPDVKGVIIESEESDNYIRVYFEDLIAFSGNPYKGSSCDWRCNLDLLFLTPEKARANHIPGRE